MRNTIVSYAVKASTAYQALNDADKSFFKKYFHLRPTQNGVTIVSTLPCAPMRGITNLQTEEEIKKTLEAIIKSNKAIVSDDEVKAKSCLDKLGFQCRKKGPKENKLEELLEEDFQARMINTMHNSNVLKALGNDKKINFIASEFIFEQGKHRIDIVGYDSETVYFFELKKDRTTKVDQVKKYVDYYMSPTNNPLFTDVMSKYPMNPVIGFKNVKGVMVMRYAENSVEDIKWTELAKQHGVDILFFKESLDFVKVNKN